MKRVIILRVPPVPDSTLSNMIVSCWLTHRRLVEKQDAGAGPLLGPCHKDPVLCGFILSVMVNEFLERSTAVTLPNFNALRKRLVWDYYAIIIPINTSEQIP